MCVLRVSVLYPAICGADCVPGQGCSAEVLVHTFKHKINYQDCMKQGFKDERKAGMVFFFSELL